jgi:hypothetical protein
MCEYFIFINRKKRLPKGIFNEFREGDGIDQHMEEREGKLRSLYIDEFRDAVFQNKLEIK